MQLYLRVLEENQLVLNCDYFVKLYRQKASKKSFGCPQIGNLRRSKPPLNGLIHLMAWGKMGKIITGGPVCSSHLERLM